MTNKKEHLIFFIFFLAIIVVFLRKIVTMQGIFIGGDNLVQFYPWFKVYAESIKKLQFPFWIRYMQSGFPLMAEGQVGGYYPLNILFFLILPFKFAYNYSIVFHFILAGFSTYFLTRKLGSCGWGSALSSLIFCFGSAYAGCFYNIITLRTLSWTPLVFLLFEYYFNEKKIVYLLIAAIVFGFQLLAGFVQVAFYSGIFYLFYFGYKTILGREGLARRTLDLFLFYIVAGLIFLPQYILTSKLVSYSTRSDANLGFALWGSFNPLGVIGAIFSTWAAFTRNDFYMSVLGLLFLITSLYLLKDKNIRPIFLILVGSFLVAIGRYNPVYVVLLKLMKFYTLRNPSKVLFFTLLSASILIGRGFSELFKMKKDSQIKIIKIYTTILLLSAFIFLFSKWILSVFKEQILSLGRWYAEKIIYGSSHHIYDLQTYLQKVDSFYDLMLNSVSFLNIFNITSWVMIVGGIVISFLILKKGKLNLKKPVFIIILIDLYIYSFIGTGFRGNILGFDKLVPTHTKILDYIKEDKELFRVLPYDIASGKLPLWILPNSNIIYEIDSVAGYTPLANKYYQESLKSLGIIDSSLGVIKPDSDPLDKNLQLIRLLNVKYIISAEKLEKPFLDFILTEEEVYLYRLKDSLPRAFVLKELNAVAIGREIEVETIDFRSGKGIFKVNMPYKGYLVFSENRYPGWRVYVDDKIKNNLPFLLIQAVELNKGKHMVKFSYHPYSN